MQLGPAARARGFRVLALGDIDSTNDEARRQIASGERGPLWIVAERQTKGRGRMGRDWFSPRGNLFASLIFSDLHDAQTAPQLGFVIGVAAMRALNACLPALDIFGLKWPNDMLMKGCKLGGVLLEGVSIPTGDARAPLATCAIIGIGVNIGEAPRNLPYPAIALAEIGPDAPSAENFFACLSDALIETLDLWRGGDGFAHIREEWLRYASSLGEEIGVALTDETLRGRFETIDAAGRLVLATPSGARVIDAGDVVIGPRSVAGASG